MDNTWVLVANAAEACLYSTERPGEDMTLLKQFSHPEGRAKGSTLLDSDRSHGRGPHSGTRGDETVDPKDFEEDRFARQLADELDKGRLDNAYRRLALVAAPHFHGLLNTHLNEHTRALVKYSINKDFTDCDTRELPERLKAGLE
jgi:protein required for attachment to host cells